jgi:hypothetical protein
MSVLEDGGEHEDTGERAVLHILSGMFSGIKGGVQGAEEKRGGDEEAEAEDAHREEVF